MQNCQNGTAEAFLLLLLLFIITSLSFFLTSFSPLVFLFLSVVFIQALYFCSLPGNNMYVPGGCNIPLVSDCDLKCDRKKKLMGNIQIASLYKLSLLLCFLPIFMKGAKRARALSF